MKNKLIIVAGCSGSGKTTVATRILQCFKKGQAQVVCLDRFYFGKSKKVPFIKKIGQYNFDHPNSIDWKLLEKCIDDLLKNKSTYVPRYDYAISKRDKKLYKIQPTRIVILEGTLPLYNEKIRNLASLKIFVKTPMDVCFIRRLVRDQKDRGQKLDSIIQRWQSSVRPMYEQYVYPTKSLSNIILPWDGENEIGLDVVLNSIKRFVK